MLDRSKPFFLLFALAFSFNIMLLTYKNGKLVSRKRLKQ